ncbi:Thiol-specific monooxygenase [Lachnellula occidentalis]|uniref:Thiol-specific monooxygenase n=1 Tax=Lachnellula occidentalis TaxID=215460 RepID=A0A8H8S6T7_9HELO|nr:Thiol-specific monooxygenase [Lachnellula occidentalis]
MGSVLRATSSLPVKRIAIIGAGPSGLAAAKFLRAEEYFDTIDIFEQQSEVGGVWHYTPSSGEKVSIPSTNPNVPLEKPIWPDGSKAPIFSNPMYEHLNTNIPKQLMCFSDQAFPAESLLFPARQDVQEYLVKYSQDVRDIISFSTQVDDVQLLKEGHWEVTTKSTITGASRKNEYDAVAVSNGHYSVPFIPSVTGIEAFDAAYPNLITHSKIYRSPEKFTGKKVIVVGSGASGLDIGTQISLVSNNPLLCSVRTPLPQLGQEKEEVPPIAEYLVEEKGVRFEDGRVEKDIDAIVYCTGYIYSYPFLKALDPAVTNGRRAVGLYEHIFNIAHPTLAFLGLPQKVIPFPVAEVQAAAVAKFWSDRLELPTKEKMQIWEKKRVEDTGEGTNFHVFGYPQDAEYINGLHDWVKLSGFKKVPVYWGPEQLWCRRLYAEVREKWVETGGIARSMEELGFKFDQDEWNRR